MIFALTTLPPLALIIAAAIWGGIWAALAPLWMTGLTASLDEIIKRLAPPRAAQEFPAETALSVALALGHFVALVLTVWAMGGGWLGGWEKAGLFVAMGLFAGQVSNSNAHELIHRGQRALHRLGMWVYVSNLFGHHTSAHVLVHHRNVGTPEDPNTARLGETFYRFARRAWVGSFRAGYRAEKARLTQTGRAGWRHPYGVYLAGTGLCIAIAAGIAGPIGVLAYLALGVFAVTQLLMSDYVQHYGLWRDVAANGKPEPVAARHSWNSPHWFSSGLMLNAPRHSDHHAHPTRSYPNLTLPDQGPLLPRSLPVMACVALYPKLWQRVMDPRVHAMGQGQRKG